MIVAWVPEERTINGMTSTLPNLRYERKFTTSTLTLPEVLARVRQHPAAFREAYPPRCVNNVYLDSPSLSNYSDHVNGISHRTKTRIRWYGVWSGPISVPHLERKVKRGLVGGKISHRLPPIEVNAGMTRASVERAFNAAGLPESTRSALHLLQPSLLNRYHRHYFRSADGQFRLTVDSDLQFAPVRPHDGLAPSFGPAASLIVVELKFGLAEAPAAERVTNALPFRMVRCSKYVLGIANLIGS
jgi:hypothetical protein